MDMQTGDIYTPEQIERLRRIVDGDGNCDREERERIRALFQRCTAMEIPPTKIQMRRVPPKVGRNDPCPCGSGKKFKRCCLSA